MACGGHMTQNFECARGIARDISNGYKEDHDRVGRLVGAGGGSPTDNALQVCTFKVPASTISGPDLFSALAHNDEQRRTAR